jgi:hypothetical protein
MDARRLILPGACGAIGLVAVALLAWNELRDEPAPAREVVVLAPETPAPAPQGKIELVAAPVAPAPVVERARPATGVAGRALVLPPLQPGAAKVKETPEVLGASDQIVALARAATLADRLRIVDHLAATLDSDAAVSTFSGLLDSELPGDFYEAESLRLCVLARLGEVPGARADAVLVSRLNAERPRPERLVALEMLAARPDAGRNDIEAVARDDHDSVVQEKARWALARTR